MDKSVYLKANPDIVFREENEGAFLFNSVNCELKGLNDTGKLIWALCDGSRSEEKVLEDVFESFTGADRQVVMDEVRAFIDELKKIDYIREERGSSC